MLWTFDKHYRVYCIYCIRHAAGMDVSRGAVMFVYAHGSSCIVNMLVLRVDCLIDSLYAFCCALFRTLIAFKVPYFASESVRSNRMGHLAIEPDLTPYVFACRC